MTPPQNHSPVITRLHATHKHLPNVSSTAAVSTLSGAGVPFTVYSFVVSSPCVSLCHQRPQEFKPTLYCRFTQRKDGYQLQKIRADVLKGRKDRCVLVLPLCNYPGGDLV